MEGHTERRKSEEKRESKMEMKSKDGKEAHQSGSMLRRGRRREEEWEARKYEESEREGEEEKIMRLLLRK